jgi:hypothetical protein
VDWDALVAAGLYDPTAGNAADRRALLEFLVEEGCTLDEMVAADARGRLFGLAGDRKIRPGRDTYSLREVAERTGADLDLVMGCGGPAACRSPARTPRSRRRATWRSSRCTSPSPGCSAKTPR